MGGLWWAVLVGSVCLTTWQPAGSLIFASVRKRGNNRKETASEDTGSQKSDLLQTLEKMQKDFELKKNEKGKDITQNQETTPQKLRDLQEKLENVQKALQGQEDDSDSAQEEEAFVDILSQIKGDEINQETKDTIINELLGIGADVKLVDLSVSGLVSLADVTNMIKKSSFREPTKEAILARLTVWTNLNKVIKAGIKTDGLIDIEAFVRILSQVKRNQRYGETKGILRGLLSYILGLGVKLNLGVNTDADFLANVLNQIKVCKLDDATKRPVFEGVIKLGVKIGVEQGTDEDAQALIELLIKINDSHLDEKTKTSILNRLLSIGISLGLNVGKTEVIQADDELLGKVRGCNFGPQVKAVLLNGLLGHGIKLNLDLGLGSCSGSRCGLLGLNVGRGFRGQSGSGVDVKIFLSLFGQLKKCNVNDVTKRKVFDILSAQIGIDNLLQLKIRLSRYTTFSSPRIRAIRSFPGRQSAGFVIDILFFHYHSRVGFYCPLPSMKLAKLLPFLHTEYGPVKSALVSI